MSDNSGKKRGRSPSRGEYPRAGPPRVPAGGSQSHQYGDRGRDNRPPPTSYPRDERTPAQYTREVRPRHEPRWVHRHPWGFHHDRGCPLCTDHENHVETASRHEPELALAVTNAIARDPDRLRSRLDDAEDTLEEVRRELQTERRRADDLQFELERERNRRPPIPPPQLIPRPLPPPPPRPEPQPEPRADPSAGLQRLEETLLELQRAQTSIRMLEDQVAEAQGQFHNYRLHSAELVSHLLRGGHNVTAAAGGHASGPVPRPFFTIERTSNGADGRLTVPSMDPDVVMTDGSSEKPTPPLTEDRVFQADTSLHLRRLKRDIYDGLDDEDDYIPSDDSEESDGSGSRGGRDIMKSKQKGKGKAKEKIESSPSKEGEDSFDATGFVIPHQFPVNLRTSWRHSVLNQNPSSSNTTRPPPVVRHGWGDEESLARGHDIGPVPDWGNLSHSGSMRPAALATSVLAGPSGTRRSNFEGGGGTNTLLSTTTPRQENAHASTTDSTLGEEVPGPFNGVPWTARRIPPPTFPPGMSAEDKQEMVRRSGANAARPALGRGQLPPRFAEANVTSISVIRDLIARTTSEMNPGALLALEILGDLKNAASRAPRPRHELENFLLHRFGKRPAWAGPGGKKAKKVEPTPTGAVEQAASLGGTAGAANPFIDTNIATSSNQTTQPAQDVPMKPPSDEGEQHHVPPLTGMDSGVGGADDNATEPQRGPLGETAPVITGNPDDFTAMLLAGFNTPNVEVARQFLALLNSPDSPLNRPSEDVWDPFVNEHTGVHIFGIPLDNSSTQSRQLRNGLLAVVRRIPSPRTVRDVFFVLRTLRGHWTGTNNFIRAGLDPYPALLTRDEITNGIAVIHHFSTYGFTTGDVIDIAALLNYILDHNL
ncbi:hypothetical protein QCA50_018650 [Cerrena zonata]|uniref:Uncharacterized protein n=1 Tax=Cerrena zonata TaxID=2478898 RepID=A0AAW0FGA4_9APHY